VCVCVCVCVLCVCVIMVAAVDADPDVVYYLAKLFVFFLALFAVLDFALLRSGALGATLKSDRTGGYFALHVLCNAYVSVVHLPDVVHVYRDPVRAATVPPGGTTNCDGIMAIAALHMWHIIAYRPLPFIDWLHHIVMVVVMLPCAVMVMPSYLLGHGAFFSSGLPGGLDYLMLVFVKLKWMESITEKRINARIQTWMRNPGMLYHALVSWTCMCDAARGRSWYEVFVSIGMPELRHSLVGPVFSVVCIFVVIVTFFWNGPFFQARVLYNLGYREAQQRAAKQQ